MNGGVDRRSTMIDRQQRFGLAVLVASVRLVRCFVVSQLRRRFVRCAASSLLRRLVVLSCVGVCWFRRVAFSRLSSLRGIHDGCAIDPPCCVNQSAATRTPQVTMNQKLVACSALPFGFGLFFLQQNNKNTTKLDTFCWFPEGARCRSQAEA